MRDLPVNDIWKISNEESEGVNLKDSLVPTMAERYVDFVMPESNPFPLMAFRFEDAERLMDMPDKRLARLGLKHHPAKTRLVDLRMPRSETRDLLQDIAEHAHALLLDMRTLRGQGIESLKDRRPTLGEIEEAIALLAEDARQAAMKLDQAVPAKRKGADRPKRIADQAALDFVRICGRPPSLVTEKDTRMGLLKGRSVTRGVFLDFLTKVFAALNVDADPLRHAREAISRFKRDAVRAAENPFSPAESVLTRRRAAHRPA
jgi:hypothetical protein